MGIEAKQWRHILDSLNLPKHSLKSHFSWILDTGATHHVTGNFAHLRNAKKIQGCPVGLPHNSSADATYEGHVVLHGNLKVTNVVI